MKVRLGRFSPLSGMPFGSDSLPEFGESGKRSDSETC